MADGTPEGTRTPDPLLRRQLLYPPELQAHIMRFSGPRAAVPQGKRADGTSELPAQPETRDAKPCPDAGAGDGNRTHATSLEGWDSTIELHPHLRRSLLYLMTAKVSSIFFKLIYFY